MPTKPKTIDQLRRAQRGHDSRHQEYDRTKRDQRVRGVHNSRRWRRVRELKLEMSPLCERCGDHDNLQVHHIVKVRLDYSKAFDLENLMTVCPKCHADEERKS